jgi:peptidoglycan/LPS O-acetylase OafA/YrhL
MARDLAIAAGSATGAGAPSPAVGGAPVRVDASRGHLPSVDAMRALAIVGVVWIHVVARTPWEQWHVIGRFGAEFFVAIATFFLTFRYTPGSRTSLLSFAGGRFRRLMVPFIAWFAIYWSLGHVLDPRVIDHLWFLPFLYVGVVCFRPVAQLTAGSGWRVWAGVVLLVLGGLATAWIESPLPGDVGHTRVGLGLGHAWGFVPGLFWGAALGLVLRGRVSGEQATPWLAAVGAIVGVGSIWALALSGSPMNSGLRNLAAVGCVMVAVGLPRGAVADGLRPVGLLAYGIYLIHPAITYLWSAVNKQLNVTMTLWMAVLEVVVVTALSMVITKLLQESKWLGWMIPSADSRGRQAAVVEPAALSGVVVMAGVEPSGN